MNGTREIIGGCSVIIVRKLKRGKTRTKNLCNFFCHGIGIKTVFGYTIVVSGEQLRAMQCTFACSRLLLLQVEPRTEKGNMDFFCKRTGEIRCGLLYK